MRIIKGTGDQYDNRARAKGVTASFSLNGLGITSDEPADLLTENEELKVCRNNFLILVMRHARVTSMSLDFI